MRIFLVVGIVVFCIVSCNFKKGPEDIIPEMVGKSVALEGLTSFWMGRDSLYSILIVTAANVTLFSHSVKHLSICRKNSVNNLPIHRIVPNFAQNIKRCGIFTIMITGGSSDMIFEG